MKRFGFAKLRFFIAVILLIAAGLKAYQLATAPLPPVVQGSVFTPLLELLNERYFLMAVVVGEILFALVLVANLWRSWMWLLSLLGFSAFTLVSVMKGLSGEASCGCFGAVTVNPWLTATFDAAIVGLLLVFRERIDWTFPVWDRKKVLVVLFVWLVLAVPTVFAILSLKQKPHATFGTETVGADGRKTITLEPEKWANEDFALLEHTDLKGRLDRGVWLVLLHTHTCSSCQESVRLYRDLAMEFAQNETAPEIAMIELPPYESEQTVANPDDPVVYGKLDKSCRWRIMSPALLLVDDRKVQNVFDNPLEIGLIRSIWGNKK